MQQVQVYSGVITAKLLDQFTNLVKKSIQQYINDLITERLKSALTKESETVVTAEPEKEVANTATATETKVETTEEEIEAFLIVKTILRQKIKPSRIVHRDAQSYFAILLDDNNRKTICRIYLNGSKRYLGTFDEQKKETRNEILTVDDIFNYGEILIKTVSNYDGDKGGKQTVE